MPLYRQKGGKVWWMSYSFRGRQIRKSTGSTNKKVAESIFYKVKTQIAEGAYLSRLEVRAKHLLIWLIGI